MMGRSCWESYQGVKCSSLERLREEHKLKRLNPNNNFRGQTLLTTSVVKGRLDVLELLLELGADPNLRSDEGGRREPPLITAVRLKNYPCVQILMSSGASLAGKNFYGQNAIYQAVVENAYEILEYLLNQPLRHETIMEDHSPCRVCCPFYLASTQALTSPSKRKCFLLLLRLHYYCPCVSKLCQGMTLSRDERKSGSESEHAGIIRVEPEVGRWIYMSLGHRVAQGPGHEEDNQNNTSRSNSRSSSRTSNNSSSNPFELKLKYLARIYIRRSCSISSRLSQMSFKSTLAALPLPPRLVSFLLLDDI